MSWYDVIKPMPRSKMLFWYAIRRASDQENQAKEKETAHFTAFSLEIKLKIRDIMRA